MSSLDFEFYLSQITFSCWFSGKNYRYRKIHYGSIGTKDEEQRQRLYREGYFVKQVHGTRVLELGDQPNREGLGFPPTTEADGMTAPVGKNMFLVVQTADCIPILFWHAGQKKIGVLHAGWRGLHGGILSQVLNKPQDAEDWFFFIGPHISVDHYEVQEDFLNQFRSLPHWDPQIESYLVATVHRRTYFSLIDFLLWELYRHNIPGKNIFVAENTTMDPCWHSHRRDQDKRDANNLNWIGSEPLMLEKV